MKNILCASNYKSDVGYAWWLMESFWVELSKYSTSMQGKCYLTFPELNALPDTILNSSIKPLEMDIFRSGKQNEERLKQFIISNSIDTIYLTDKPYVSLFYFKLRVWGIKTIIVHDHTPGDRPPILGIRGVLKSVRARLSIISADAVFCISPLMRERAVLNARFPASKCIVVQNGIKAIKPSCSRVEVRKGLNISEEDIVFVTTGRLHAYKRQSFIIEAFYELSKVVDRPDLIKLLIIGDGPDKKKCESLVKEKELDDLVKFLGYRDDVVDVLQASDVAVHAALGEGFALSIVEYMAMSLPVIVSNIPSVKQAVDEGRSGLVFDKDDPLDLTKKMNCLLSNESMRISMGHFGKKIYQEQLTFDKCLQNFNKAICEIEKCE